MAKKDKTNVMRLLDKANIPYRTAEYEADETDLSGVHAAEQIGMPKEQVFKTLVSRGEHKGILVFCIPVAEELNLKKAAALAGDKKIEMLPLKELLAVTGYIRGGCSPIGMKKKYPTWLDESAFSYDEIAVSAGQRGHQVIVNPGELAEYIGAESGKITKKE
ncbi:Cys-tRNA(Pro) deacylase [Anaerolentibacter hominis]|uniref:Cys-tRNA(Pro) deacylase n=1 Tax=Anaerolentibacter hominis TaxID=3079009 RepID=UPI0031B8471B